MRLLLIILTALVAVQCVTFLEDTPHSYLEVSDPSTIIKIFKREEKVYELKSYIEKRLNESFMVFKVNAENSKTEYFSFEGTYNQIVSYDPEWKVFKTTEQIFAKVIRNDIASDKFNVSIEKTDMIFQFTITIVDEQIPLKIKLTRDVSTQTDSSFDSQLLIDKIANLEGEIQNIRAQLRRREVELFSTIAEMQIINDSAKAVIIKTNGLIEPIGKVAEFSLDMSSTQEVDILVEMQCARYEKYTEFYATLDLTNPTGQKYTHKLFYIKHYYIAGSVASSGYGSTIGGTNTNETEGYHIKKIKSLNLMKGNYKAQLNIFGSDYTEQNNPKLLSVNNGYKPCHSLIVKKIEK